MPGSRKRQTPEQKQKFRLSRRGLLLVAGTGVAGHLVGCGDDGKGGGTGGAGGSAGTGGTGTGGSGTGGKGGATGTGGAGGSASAGTGGTGTGGTGTGGGGAGGSGGSGTGGSGTAGTGGSGGAQDGSSPDYSADARIEVGNPPGMPDGGNATCVITRRDQLGPYHLDGHPTRSMMATANDGQILIVTGRVLNTKCQPLGGAELDVWSANARGVYSEVPGGWCRGKVRADADGYYKFETVYPGVYQGRPRHLHLIIGQTGYAKVTTQMYFKGERPDIPANAVDKVMANGVLNSQWNIVLAGGAMASRIQTLQPPAGNGRIVAPGSFPRRFWGSYPRRA
jgi:protocatechuate 3,4-dioxygenase beta subunit